MVEFLLSKGADPKLTASGVLPLGATDKLELLEPTRARSPGGVQRVMALLSHSAYGAGN